MAECALTGFNPNACEDITWASGLKKRVYLARRADILSYTKDLDGNVSDITFDTYKGLVKFFGGKEGNGGEQDLQQASGNVYLKQSLNLKIIQHNADVNTSLNALIGVDDVVAIVETQNNTFRMYFKENGAFVASLKQADGAKIGEDATYNITLEGAEKELVPDFLDTDYDTTLALLEGYVIA